MGASEDLEQLRRYWSRASDAEVREAFARQLEGYRPEAVALIRAEAEKRGLEHADPAPAAHPAESRPPRNSRQFSAGSVLGRGVSIWRTNLVRFVPLTFVILLPALALSAWSFAMPPADRWTANLFEWGGWLVTVLLSQVVSATLIAAVFRQLRGRPGDVRSSLSQGLARLLPVVGAASLNGLLLALALSPSIAALALLGDVSQAGCFLLLLILANLALVARVYCALWVAVPVVVVEQQGPVAALKRSLELTRGRRLQIFGLLTLVSMLVGLATRILAFALRSADPLLAFLGDWIVDVLALSLQSVVICVGYHALRVEKEGVDVEELAAIFD